MPAAEDMCGPISSLPLAGHTSAGTTTGLFALDGPPSPHCSQTSADWRTPSDPNGEQLMSAFVVHPEHINVLLWAGLKDPRLGALRWEHMRPTHSTELQPETATEIGQILLDENVKSVNHSYGTEMYTPKLYTYRPPLQRGWTNVELLNALHCYQYQASEHPDWESSQAYAFCQALERRLIRRLPGYSDGPWAIGPESLPAAARRAFRPA